MTAWRAHILLAEDDLLMRPGLVDTLEGDGYRVTAVADGRAALQSWVEATFDLLILDVMMPGASGFEVCRAVRARDETVPILMLTAKSEELDKVVGLRLGADDYLTKPFGIHELLARVAALLRRGQRRSPEMTALSRPRPDTFCFGAVEVRCREHAAVRAGSRLKLSPKELELLLLFHESPGAVLAREDILEALWGDDYDGATRTLDQYVVRLRKKVEPEPSRPRVIVTIHTVGYRYDPL
ncbi:MAG: response regulator transcription factor [Candidatus Schekmanbacteria bacterium]|nr:response regulator transcription factor [Candidatus Schekmanbacteria bacterium]